MSKGLSRKDIAATVEALKQARKQIEEMKRTIEDQQIEIIKLRWFKQSAFFWGVSGSNCVMYHKKKINRIAKDKEK